VSHALICDFDGGFVILIVSPVSIYCNIGRGVVRVRSC
jgi:hypothetical protein